MTPISKLVIVPGLPHPLLTPEQNPGWQRVRDGFVEVAQQLQQEKIERLLIYSTQWPSVIGHQIQAHPEPEWEHVDELFHDLGPIPYQFTIDAERAHILCQASKKRGLQTSTVAFKHFPIDTGSVVALKLLNPEQRIPANIVSSNMYADRAETIVFAKAARDMILHDNKKTAVIVVTTLSNRMFTDFIPANADRIHSDRDAEWNQQILEFLTQGRLEDAAQLSRQIQEHIRVHKVTNFKPFWWLSAIGKHSNAFQGKLHAYEPIYGTGAAVVTLTPSPNSFGDKEFDEEDIEHFNAERSVLASTTAAAAPKTTNTITLTDTAPKPVGAYPHARRAGDFLYLSGVGPRHPDTNKIPGGPTVDANHNPQPYDIASQTQAVIDNVKSILGACGLALEDIIDITVFLIDMQRDFASFNRVYNQTFAALQPTRTTIAVNALPTPIAVEFKVVAKLHHGALS